MRKQRHLAPLWWLLTSTFVLLKLTGVIHWSWLWVLSPLWLSLLVAVALFSLAALLGELGK